MSTAQRHTAFLDDPRIIDTICESDIDFASIKTAPTTIYIVIPDDKLKTYNRYCRAIIGQALKELKTPGRGEHHVLFLLDEFARLGHFTPIEENISLVQGYGIWLWLFLQDLMKCKRYFVKKNAQYAELL